ncbi:MAG: TonB-dependent receptor plug domain-containing protein, partial [Spirochaetaceae bacterium]|nr:TonB-dependent receptor plug domain-containing protein [Spirochaetaceae bacterium]
MSAISFLNNKIFLILFVLLFVSSFGFTEETTVEKTFVITANRTKTEEIKSNGNVTIITSAEIAKSGKTSLKEILQSATNVQISEGTNGSSSSIVKMRGSAGDNPFAQVVVLFNGRRLNNPDMTPQNLLSIRFFLWSILKIISIQVSGITSSFASFSLLFTSSKKSLSLC